MRHQRKATHDGVDDEESNVRRVVMESGVIPRVPDGPGGVIVPWPGDRKKLVTVHRPSWNDVDEYLLEGKHRHRVELYAATDPDFAAVLRSMRNDLEADLEADACDDDSAPPRSARRLPSPRVSSSIPPPLD